MDGLHHGAVDRLAGDVAHEAAVQLQVIHRQVLQVGERRHAGAKVVQRELTAGAAQTVDELARAAKMGDRSGFRQFQTQPPGHMARVGAVVLDHADHARVLQRATGKVHRQARASGQQVPDRARDHIAVDQRHQPEAFGGRQEGTRQHDAPVPLAQAQQHLVPRQPVGSAECANRLHIQQQALFIQRVAQLGRPLHFTAAARKVGIAAPEQMDAIAPQVLGRVTGKVRLGQQLRGRCRAGADWHQAHAGAHGEAALPPAKAESADRAQQVMGDLRGLVRRAVGQQQAEFVAAKARQQVTAADPVLQQGGQFGQQLIAGCVAAAVVDHLELIQIHVAQGMHGIGPARLVQQFAQPVFELAPVGQTGQRVVSRLVGDLGRQAPGVGHVAKHDHRAGQGAVRQMNGRRRIFDVIFDPVAVQQDGGTRQVDRRIVGDAAQQRIVDRPAAVFMHQAKHLADRLVEGFGLRPAGQALGDRVQRRHPALGIGGDDPVADGLQRYPGQFLGSGERLFGVFAVSDIAAGEMQHARAPGRLDGQRHIQPERGAVQAQRIPVEAGKALFQRLFGLHSSAIDRRPAIRLSRRREIERRGADQLRLVAGAIQARQIGVAVDEAGLATGDRDETEGILCDLEQIAKARLAGGQFGLDFDHGADVADVYAVDIRRKRRQGRQFHLGAHPFAGRVQKLPAGLGAAGTQRLPIGRNESLFLLLVELGHAGQRGGETRRRIGILPHSQQGRESVVPAQQADVLQGHAARDRHRVRIAAQPVVEGGRSGHAGLLHPWSILCLRAAKAGLPAVGSPPTEPTAPHSAPLAAVGADGLRRFIGRRAGTLSARPRATGAREALNESILDVSAPATQRPCGERSFAAR